MIQQVSTTFAKKIQDIIPLYLLIAEFLMINHPHNHRSLYSAEISRVTFNFVFVDADKAEHCCRDFVLEFNKDRDLPTFCCGWDYIMSPQ